MTRPRIQIPSGHGELVTQPPYDQWAEIAGSVADLVEGWDVEIGGVPIGDVRKQARAEVLADAESYTTALGLPVSGRLDDLIVATGHQPELFHPGIWAKYFLLQRIAEDTGARAIDLVVDTDSFDSVSFSAPCMRPEVRVCRDYLKIGSPDTCYASVDPPSDLDIDTFCAAGKKGLDTLPAPAIVRHFDRYCGCLKEASGQANDLASALTLARRMYESPTETDYLELPVTVMSGGDAFLRLVADIALDAERFARDFNTEIEAYRAATKTRSVAQPFPNLWTSDGVVEIPLWAVGEKRARVMARIVDGRTSLMADDRLIVELPRDHDGAVDVLRECGTILAPRALLLTLYVRMLVADLFIHGVGGARYDVLTDALARRYFGIGLPGFAAASLTMYLPLGIPLVSDKDVSDARERLNRLEHNPDSFLGEVEFDSAEECQAALELAARKKELVAAIAEPGADKKALGLEIREVNQRIGELLSPIAENLAEHLADLERDHEATGVLTDRSYPFCLWSPEEVQDKVT